MILLIFGGDPGGHNDPDPDPRQNTGNNSCSIFRENLESHLPSFHGHLHSSPRLCHFLSFGCGAHMFI